MLTKRQKATLDFIVAYMRREGGVSPSFSEIQHGVGLAGNGSVDRLVDALEERGFIRRMPNRARAIEVLLVEPRVAKAEAPSRQKVEARSRDVLIPQCGAPPEAIRRLCPNGKISGAYQGPRYTESL